MGFDNFIFSLNKDPNLKIGREFEEVIDHALGADSLPVEHVVQVVAVRNVDRDHREVLQGGNAGHQRREVEGGLHDDDRRAALLLFVAGQEPLQRAVDLLHVGLDADLERVVWCREKTVSVRGFRFWESVALVDFT